MVLSRPASLHAALVIPARTMRSAAAFRDVRVAARAHGSAGRTRRGAVRPRAADPRSVIHNTDSDDTSSATFRRLSLAASTAFGAASLAAPALANELSSVDLSSVDPAVAGVGAAALAAAALVASRAGGGGAGPRPAGTATTLPGATPMTRGAGESDDSKRRGYLIAPPPLFPLVPAFARQTYRYEVDPGRMWFFEQKQGIGLGLNVSVNVRMTVIKLKTGGLWVHAPVAPTQECIALLAELDAPVEHIVLPTTLFEHKIFVGPFQRRFPEAETWIAPDQWSWPVNLPPAFFGIFPTGVLGRDAASWEDEFEYEMLQPPALGVASYVSFTECAFLHKPSKTLLVTDAVVYVSENAPDAIPDADLLESGDDNNFTIGALKFLNLFDIKTKAKARTVTSDDMSEAQRLRLGWQRNALQALYFGPSNLLDPEQSWARITNKLLVAPVVSTLVYENIPREVDDWARRVGKMGRFERIVPCHFDAPIRAGPKEWNAAFGFLPSSRPEEGKEGRYYPDEDMVLLRGVEDFLQGTGVIFTDESRPKYGRINVRAEERRSAAKR